MKKLLWTNAPKMMFQPFNFVNIIYFDESVALVGRYLSNFYKIH